MNRGADPARVFASWQSRREGFAPLFLEPVMRHALAAIAPALVPGATVLDLGSGTGHVSRVFREHGAETVCLDLDPSLLAESRTRHPGGPCVAGDAARLPLATASLDAVFVFSVLHYVQRDAALLEMRRVLRPGGRWVVVENLALHPLILAYRARRALLGHRPEPRLQPRRYLRWSERVRYEQVFPGARYQAFHLAAPALLAWRALRLADASEPADSRVRQLTTQVQAWDRAALEAAPGLAALAWTLVASGTR